MSCTQARISLTLSRHFFLSFIASGRSSGPYPVSPLSCWMYVRTGRPAFARLYVGVHRSTSLMSSSLLLQQWPACLVRLTWTETNYADDIAILANTPNQAETLLHSLERAASGIGLHVNAHKTEYMCYNQTGDITTLDRSPLKLVDKFTYLGSSVSSTEKDIDTRLTKAWTAIDSLSIIWRSDLTDKMKPFLPGSGRIDTAVWMHYLDANKTAGEEARRQLHKNAASNIEQVLAATPHKAPTIRPPALLHNRLGKLWIQLFSPYGSVVAQIGFFNFG